MLSVAIAEDEPEQRGNIKQCLKRYGTETGETFSVSEFSDGADLVHFYKSQFDLVFLDIDMERMDGMEAARIIRKTDSATAIIFVTRLAHFAVKAYDVEALDFIVKPFSYASFSMKMRRAVAYVRLRRGRTVQLKTADGLCNVRTREILYVESLAHEIVWHTPEREYHTWGSLKETAALLGDGFCLCNRSFLVNLSYVRSIEGNDVDVGGVKLPVSRYKRKAFLDALAADIPKG